MVYVKLPKSVLGLIADVNGRTVVEQIRSMIPGGGFIPIAVLMMDDDFGNQADLVLPSQIADLGTGRFPQTLTLAPCRRSSS